MVAIIITLKGVTKCQKFHILAKNKYKHKMVGVYFSREVVTCSACLGKRKGKIPNFLIIIEIQSKI